jgi:hypothetical protein
MGEKKIKFDCEYCGATYTLRYILTDGTSKPEFCGFCGESDSITNSTTHDEDEELDDRYDDEAEHDD